MKLYSTITSERATKGQGGNKFIDVRLVVGTENNPSHIYTITLTEQTIDVYHNGQHEITIHHETKGERQKGEADYSQQEENFLNRE